MKYIRLFDTFLLGMYAVFSFLLMYNGDWAIAMLLILFALTNTTLFMLMRREGILSSDIIGFSETDRTEFFLKEFFGDPINKVKTICISILRTIKKRNVG